MNAFVREWGPWIGLAGGAVGAAPVILAAATHLLTVRDKIAKLRTDRRERAYRRWCTELRNAMEAAARCSGVAIDPRDLHIARWGEEHGFFRVSHELHRGWIVFMPRLRGARF